MADWRSEFTIKKVDTDQMLVSGWLSVAQDTQGRTVLDSQGDTISPDELEKAAYNYLLDARGVGEMHLRKGVGRPVESMVFTLEKQEALGIPPGIVPVGWFVTFKIDDPDVWSGIKSGKYSAFSIGGSGNRVEVA